jgi:hypothetical protein
MHTAAALTIRPLPTRLASALEGTAGTAEGTPTSWQRHPTAGRLRWRHPYDASGVVPDEAAPRQEPPGAAAQSGGSRRKVRAHPLAGAGPRQRWRSFSEQCAGTTPNLLHAGLARVWDGALPRPAYDWPGVDWQPGICALEVEVEHDG